MKKISTVAIAALLAATPLSASELSYEAEAEAGLTKLIEKIRGERVNSRPCSAPPRSPTALTGRASKKFYKSVEKWDRCQRDHIVRLEDRVADYQYQLDNWLPDLPYGAPTVKLALRTIDIYNSRVGRARERSDKDYKFLKTTESDYQDRIDTAIRQERWAQIELDRKISDHCMFKTTAVYGYFTETLYQCIQRVKYERQLVAAGYNPYTPYYNSYNNYNNYDRANISVKVKVNVDTGGHSSSSHSGHN